MARDGIPFAAGSIGAGVIFGISGMLIQNTELLFAASFCMILLIFFIFFFRDPERSTDAGPDDVVSPGDGRVIAMEEEEDPYYFKTKVRRVSIFLSVFDVHINRIPISGTVDFLRYISGSFKAAFKKDASFENEQTAIGITDGTRKVLFKQIAGILARRIVCTLKEGQTVKTGERCGMIKFGSRVDIILPLDTEVLVSMRQKVYGGITRIGKFRNEE